MGNRGRSFYQRELSLARGGSLMDTLLRDVALARTAPRAAWA